VAKSMMACVARVRREQDSLWETAIAVGVDGNIWTFTDQQGQVIPAPVWEFRLVEQMGCFQYILPDSEAR